MIYTVTLNPARDRSIVINDFAAGKVNRVLETRDDPGGKGINVSKVIKALGGESIATGILGGESGAYIKNSLDEMDIKSDFVYTDTETRTNIKISDPKNGVTTDINQKGEINPLDAQKVFDKLLGLVKRGDTVVIAGKLDLSKVDINKWILALKHAQAKVYIDTEGDALNEALKAGPYLAKPNDKELAVLTGDKTDTSAACVSAAKEIIKSYAVETVIVSRGAGGAVFVKKNEAYNCGGLNVREVCSVGAGDTMVAAFAYAEEAGMSFKEACELSIAASAAAVTCPGTKSPELKQINALLPNAKAERLY